MKTGTCLLSCGALQIKKRNRPLWGDYPVALCTLGSVVGLAESSWYVLQADAFILGEGHHGPYHRPRNLWVSTIRVIQFSDTGLHNVLYVPFFWYRIQEDFQRSRGRQCSRRSCLRATRRLATLPTTLQPPHPQPADPASQDVVGKVRPGKGRSQDCSADKRASEVF